MMRQKRELFGRSFATVCLAVLFSLSLTGCSTTASNDTVNGRIHDPFEDINRTTFAINDALDQAVMEPVARGYRAVVPKPGRKAVHNVLTNLRSPMIFANQLLQGDLDGAGDALTRAIVNTLIGVGGIFDVAGYEGIEYEPEDFGQTLAVWGFDHGPYLVLPLIGPSSARDATGLLVDAYADPLRLYLHNIDEEGWTYARVGAEVLDRREALLDVLDDLRRNSFDYYAAVRSIYYQRRGALVRDEDEDSVVAPTIPDYDDMDE